MSSRRSRERPDKRRQYEAETPESDEDLGEYEAEPDYIETIGGQRIPTGEWRMPTNESKGQQ